MAASGDVTFAQDGGQSSIKLHPYIVTIIRWCVSCVWSTATVLLHRIITGSLPSITGVVPVSKTPAKGRAATTEHLHPEPRVECEVLHAPTIHNLDVIFVHGLYGSLGNTWRQGDWRSKYKIQPNKVPLLRPSNCQCKDTTKNKLNDASCDANINEVTYKRIDDIFKDIKILPKDDVFITEKFYNSSIMNQVEIVDNYESQAQFVRDLFENENRVCNSCDSECKSEVEISEVNCECRENDGRVCEVGCGCVCDECYSSCWPRDWIKEDYPDARVISINYTSDPYLWRPLWIKECKRLRLHERAEQMTAQLLALGVGRRPIIWVGHSKGGLFIKQIYCEAYEAFLKTQIQNNSTNEENINDRKTQDIDHFTVIDDNTDNKRQTDRNDSGFSDMLNINTSNKYNKDYHFDLTDSQINIVDNKFNSIDNIDQYNGVRDTMCFENEKSKLERCMKDESVTSSDNEEDHEWLVQKASLWTSSAGFMFYSVPHRGSPLADIKTPITARSVELLEISKDCSLVLSLQDRWLQATATSQPRVRSLVETCRTLMSVLWLRIVSVNSADAGIGSLYGVSVDHREICKPSSRHCPLYSELMTLMQASLAPCPCRS